ncbi:PxxKW family cysteine-rich protein [Desulfogranum mediterraneum]|uniref:PxxKW family cysteine-rich protein n=1 Tax=Desulfogranum mediterraneum TaxID=160661 RepID=UPI00048BE773|nr:PxxKW family cysteine-rich protein [Desulfogranum mediterraneum]
MQSNETAKFSEGAFQPVIEQCEGCERIVEVDSAKFCNTYAQPGAKWRLGICNFATHAKPEVKVVKVRINPLKAAKRANRRG